MAASFGKQVGKLSIKVLPDASKFYNAVRDMVKEAEAKYQVNLDVLAETKRAREELEKLYQEWDGKNVAMEAQVTTAKAKAELLALTRPRRVTVVANIQQKSFAAATGFLARITGARVVKSVFSDISDQILDLDKNVGKISRVSLLVAQVTSSLLAMSAGAIAAGGDFLKIINLALVGPAAFGGLAVGVTTLVVALKDASTQLAEIGPAFTQIAGSIKGAFWEQARQPIIDFVTKYLPQLDAGFTATAAAIGRQGAAIVTTLSSSMGNGVMEGLFKNLVDTIDEVTKGMAPMVQAFVTLGVIGSAYLPQFGKWLADLATQFNNWVQTGKQSGEINGLIESGIQAVKDFGGAVKGASGILVGLYDASKAAGAGGLGGLSTALQDASAVINGPAVQQALTTLFKGAGYATSSVGAGFKDIAKMLADNAPAISGALGLAGATIGSFLSAIGKALDSPIIRGGLTDLFVGIQGGAKGLEPALQPVADLIGKLMSIVGEAATQFGTILGNVKTTLAPVLDAILGVVEPLIPFFGEQLNGAIKGVTPVFKGLADAISFLQPVLTPLVGGFAVFAVGVAGVTKAIGIGKAAFGVYKDVMDKIDTARIIAMYAGDKIKAIASFTGELGKNSAAWVKNAAQATAAKAAAAGKWIADTATSIGKGTASLATQGAMWVATKAKMIAFKVAQVAVTAASKAAAAAQWLLNAAMSANPIGLIIAAIALVVAALVWFFTQTKVGQAIWSGFMSFLSDAWTNIVNVATTVFQALGSFFSGLWTGIVTVATNTWNGIVSFFTGLWATLSAFFATWGPLILAVIAPFLGIPLLIAQNWTSIVAFLTTIWTGIVTVATTVFTAIATFFSTLWTGIMTVATAIWNGIATVITSVITGVQTVVSTVISAIAAGWNAWLSGIKAVASAIWNGIQSAITSVVNGIRSVVTSVINAIAAGWNAWLSGMQAVASAIWNTIKSVVTSAINGVRSVISSVISGIQGTWSAGWNALSSVVSAVWSAIKSAVSGAVSAVSSTISQIGSALTSVKSTVTGAISGAGQWLVDSGKAIINGLISGIKSMVGAAGDAIGGVMSKIRGFLPFSPAKEGPFSGKGWTPYSGKALVEGLADGMTSRIDRVKSAAIAMTKAAQVGDLSLAMSDGSYGVDFSAVNRDNAPVIVQGNVGYNPQELADAISVRKRQAAIVAGMNMVQVR